MYYCAHANALCLGTGAKTDACSENVSAWPAPDVVDPTSPYIKELKAVLLDKRCRDGHEVFADNLFRHPFYDKVRRERVDDLFMDDCIWWFTNRSTTSPGASAGRDVAVASFEGDCRSALGSFLRYCDDDAFNEVARELAVRSVVKESIIAFPDGDDNRKVLYPRTTSTMLALQALAAARLQSKQRELEPHKFHWRQSSAGWEELLDSLVPQESTSDSMATPAQSPPTAPQIGSMRTGSIAALLNVFNMSTSTSTTISPSTSFSLAAMETLKQCRIVVSEMEKNGIALTARAWAAVLRCHRCAPVDGIALGFAILGTSPPSTSRSIPHRRNSNSDLRSPAEETSTSHGLIQLAKASRESHVGQEYSLSMAIVKELLFLLASQGSASRSRWLLDEVTARGSDCCVECHLLVLQSMILCNNFDEAEIWIETLEATQSDKTVLYCLYEKLLDTYAGVGAWDRAEFILSKDISHSSAKGSTSSIRPRTWLGILEMMAKCGHVRSCLAILEKYGDQSFNKLADHIDGGGDNEQLQFPTRQLLWESVFRGCLSHVAQLTAVTHTRTRTSTWELSAAVDDATWAVNQCESMTTQSCRYYLEVSHESYSPHPSLKALYCPGTMFGETCGRRNRFCQGGQSHTTSLCSYQEFADPFYCCFCFEFTSRV